MGAAALASLSVIVLFHGGQTTARTELTGLSITPGEYAQNAGLTREQMYGYNGYRSAPATYVSSMHPADIWKRYNDYSRAIQSAQQSQEEMNGVVQHYRDLYEKSYKRGFATGQQYQKAHTGPRKFLIQEAQGLGKSAEAWKAREKLLNDLHYEIVNEQSKLATLHGQEKDLLQKHQLMKGTVDTLLRSSAATAKEIQFLRDRYAEQIAGVQAQLQQAQEDRLDQHNEWMKKSNFDFERVSGLKAAVSSAIATSDYYKDKASEAKSNQEIYRDRALRTASDANAAKLVYTSSLKAAIEAHEKELEAIAAKNVRPQ